MKNNMTLLEKLNLLPEKITYRLPFCASGVNQEPDEKNMVWSEETGIYELEIFKFRDEKNEIHWNVLYTHYNIYEGYPEIHLPAKLEEDIIREIKKDYKTETIEDWMLGEDYISSDYSDTDLEKVVDKVLEWLRKEGLLN